MSTTRVNAPYVYVQRVVATKLSEEGSGGEVATVTAPDIDGYTFVAWIEFISSWYVGSPYGQPHLATTSIWDANLISNFFTNSKSEIICYALYQRTTS